MIKDYIKAICTDELKAEYDRTPEEIDEILTDDKVRYILNEVFITQEKALNKVFKVYMENKND